MFVGAGAGAASGSTAEPAAPPVSPEEAEARGQFEVLVNEMLSVRALHSQCLAPSLRLWCMHSQSSSRSVRVLLHMPSSTKKSKDIEWLIRGVVYVASALMHWDREDRWMVDRT